MNERKPGRLPDFIAVGPPRTATTWMDTVLRGHVGLPLGVKETHFFGRNYGRGLAWYESHFHHCACEPVVGEICASYFKKPSARKRIHRLIPQCRIICSVRDPVEKVHSYYKLMCRNGRVEGTFEQALEDPRMVEAARYASHIREWQGYFGKENVLVVFYDDLKANPQIYLDGVTDFIGIQRVQLTRSALAKKLAVISQAPRNAALARGARMVRHWLSSHRFYATAAFIRRMGVWKFCSEGGQEFAPLQSQICSRIRDLLRPEIEALEDLVGRDLSSWKDGPQRDLQRSNHGSLHSGPERSYPTTAKPCVAQRLDP